MSIPEKIDKYVVLGELGRGAMGTVYKARDPVLDRLVAIKMMSEELLIEEEMRGRFVREAKSAAALQHPNIVTVFDFGELAQTGAQYIVMELLGGHSLAELIEDRKPERLQDKLNILTQVCRGLDYAHQRGVIHRDVKPGNIQVLPSGTAKVLDFGIAAGGAGSTVMTKTGLVMGTPNYMAPEQIAGENVDHRADMWAVGVILYELLTGERPFAAETVPSLVYRIVHASPTPLDARRLGLPDALIGVVQRVLSKGRDDRFRDLSQVASTLEQLGAVGPSSAARASSRVDPPHLAHLQLARTYLASSEPARALEAARKAQALEPSDPAVVALVKEVEDALARMQSEETLVQTDTPPARPETFDAGRWVDEARMALTGGNRTEAMRILQDVLDVAPQFQPAVELKELLDSPARPGRPPMGSGRIRTARQRVRPEVTFMELASFGGAPGIQVLAVGLSPEIVAVGGVDGSVRLWDIDARSRVASFRTELHQRAGHEALVTSLAFSPDGAFLASGHVDGNVHLWGLDVGEEVRVRLRHDASIGQLAFSPDGDTLASGGLDNTLKLWDVKLLRRGEAQRRLIRQPAGVTTLDYTPDGRELITGHTNRILRIHDAGTGRLTATLRGHQAAVTTAAFSADGVHLATGARDCVIRVFDLNRKEEVKTLVGHKKAVTGLCYFPTGNELASVSMDNGVILWDLASGKPRTTLWGGSSESFAGVVVTGEEPLIVGGLTNGGLKVWAPEFAAGD